MNETQIKINELLAKKQKQMQKAINMLNASDLDAARFYVCLEIGTTYEIQKIIEDIRDESK